MRLRKEEVQRVLFLFCFGLIIRPKSSELRIEAII